MIVQSGRVAITTRYYGPTNHRGPRYKADAGEGRIIWIKDDPEWNYPDGHRHAAMALMRKMGWQRSDVLLIEGGLPKGDHVYTMVVGNQFNVVNY